MFTQSRFCSQVSPPLHDTLRWHHNGRDGVSNHQPHDCLLDRLFRRRPKKASKLSVTGLCVGNSQGTGEFPTQRASIAENVSIWCRHHEWNMFSLKKPHYSKMLPRDLHDDVGIVNVSVCKIMPYLAIDSTGDCRTNPHAGYVVQVDPLLKKNGAIEQQYNTYFTFLFFWAGKTNCVTVGFCHFCSYEPTEYFPRVFSTLRFIINVKLLLMYWRTFWWNRRKHFLKWWPFTRDVGTINTLFI